MCVKESPVGYLLFCIYIYDKYTVLRCCKYHVCADNFICGF